MYRTWEVACEEARRPQAACDLHVAAGQDADAAARAELSQMEHLYIMCGHYEGVDQRVLDEIADEEISIGDYVLTGGELGALVLIDCVARLCPGVLADESCYEQESHWDGLLEYPQYTKLAVWHGVAVPEIITNGNHAAIARWRREQSLKTTYEKRPSFCAQRRLQKKTNGTCARLAGPTIRMTAAGRAEAHAPSFSTGCPGYVDIIVENFMVKLHNRAFERLAAYLEKQQKIRRDKKEKQNC